MNDRKQAIELGRVSLNVFGGRRAWSAAWSPTAPLWTDGKWVPEQKRVDWSHSFYVHDTEGSGNAHVALDWPKFCFAVWNEPSEEAQKKLFGMVAVDGKELLNYCIWY